MNYFDCYQIALYGFIGGTVNAAVDVIHQTIQLFQTLCRQCRRFTSGNVSISNIAYFVLVMRLR